jgi:ParB-like chromosome segregation protein Spo0J
MRDPRQRCDGGAGESVAAALTPCLDVRLLPVAALHPWERNPRRIGHEGWRQLLDSLRDEPELMRARPLIVRTDGAVLAGNMRYRAALALGWGEVPAVVVDADERRSIRIAVRDNSHPGEWDEDALAELLAELGDPSADGAAAELAREAGMLEREVERLFAAPDHSPDLPEPDWTARRCPACGHVWREV